MFDLIALSENALTWTEVYNTPIGFRNWLLEKYKKFIQEKINHNRKNK